MKAEPSYIPTPEEITAKCEVIPPTVQIVHVSDWHFVDRELFEADGGEDWEAFLASVENVQSQQIDC